MLPLMCYVRGRSNRFSSKRCNVSVAGVQHSVDRPAGRDFPARCSTSSGVPALLAMMPLCVALGPEQRGSARATAASSKARRSSWRNALGATPLRGLGFGDNTGHEPCDGVIRYRPLSRSRASFIGGCHSDRSTSVVIERSTVDAMAGDEAINPASTIMRIRQLPYPCQQQPTISDHQGSPLYRRILCLLPGVWKACGNDVYWARAAHPPCDRERRDLVVSRLKPCAWPYGRQIEPPKPSE